MSDAPATAAGAAAPPFLAIDGVTKRFGATQALAGIDLTVGADELLVVLGPTGAGKTTLLRIVCGLEAADAGRVLMDGVDVGAWPPARRDVALVFQDFSLYPDWTVRRNLAFPLRAPGRGLDEAEIERRVRWAAELLDIGPLLDKPSNRLSGGQMQRVAIGRAIVRRPRLFLLDEPLASLDAKLRERLRAELTLLRRELHAPMVLVTHDQVEALAMGDRIAVVDRGRLLQVGTPQDVYQRPASPAVARLLGQPPINLLAATAAGRRWTVAGAALTDAGGAPDGAGATLGVRPEHVAIVAADADGAHPARVRLVEESGPVRTVVLAWAGGELHAVVAHGAPALRIDDRVALRIDPLRVRTWPASVGDAGP